MLHVSVLTCVQMAIKAESDRDLDGGTESILFLQMVSWCRRRHGRASKHMALSALMLIQTPSCTANVSQVCHAEDMGGGAHRAFAVLAEDGLGEPPAVAAHAHGAGAAQALLQPLLLPQQLQVHRLQPAILHGMPALARLQVSQDRQMAANSAAQLWCRAGTQCCGCTDERPPLPSIFKNAASCVQQATGRRSGPTTLKAALNIACIPGNSL